MGSNTMNVFRDTEALADIIKRGNITYNVNGK